MKALVCGAGGVTRELLRRLGGHWEVTLVGKSAKDVEQCRDLFPDMAGVHLEDPSSPVVLDEAGIGSAAYVLALTDNDRVNLAIARYAVEKRVPHVLALVHSVDSQAAFRELGVQAVMANRLLSQHIVNYLQDPRITVTPITAGQSSVYEVNATNYFRIVGKRASYFEKSDLRLAAILRRGELLFPTASTEILTDDRLILVGRPEIFQPVCDLLECGSPHFPLAYGPTLLVCLPWEEDKPREPLLNEGLYLSRTIKVTQASILCPHGFKDVEKQCRDWPQEVSVRVSPAEIRGVERIVEASRQANCGLVVVPPFAESFLKSLTRPTLISLAHELDCPLLLARNTCPYEKILVPFNGTAMAEAALDVAVDLARQVRAELGVISVVEPEFIKGSAEGQWVESIQNRLKELAHIHKMDVVQMVRRGNPVREIVSIAKGYGLMVLGSTVKEKSLLTPHVGENLAQKAPCSVLVLTS
jgi:Trk K+ transport system NAD-binding subunit/nucleotide-binding universal stress UspA family protein